MTLYKRDLESELIYLRNYIFSKWQLRSRIFFNYCSFYVYKEKTRCSFLMYQKYVQ